MRDFSYLCNFMISHCHIMDDPNRSCLYQSFIYSPTDALVSCLKKTILNFTLKQLRHVSVLQLTPSSGSATPKHVGAVLM